MTVRNLGGRGGVGAGVAAGALGGLSRGLGTLGSHLERKAERERKKPFEDLQLKSLTQQTEQADIQAEEKKATKTAQLSMLDFIKSKFPDLDENTQKTVAEMAEKANTKNSTIQDALDDPDLIEATVNPDKANQILTDIGATDESERGQEVRKNAIPEAQSYLDTIIAETKKPIDDLGVPTAKEIEEGGVLQPGQPAPEAPKTAVFRPGETGELEKVEPEQEPENVKRAREVMDKLISTNMINDPMFKNTVSEMKTVIDDFESGKAAAAAAKEKERIRKEDIGFKEKKFESEIEQKRLDRESRERQKRLDREDAALTRKQLALTEADEAQKVAIPGLDPMENVSITKESIKKVKEAAPMIEGVETELKNLKELYKKTGVKLVGKDAARLKSKVRKIQLQLKGKAFLDLGVLNGPDLDLLNEIVPDVTGLKAGAKKKAFGDIFQAQLDELDQFIVDKKASFYRTNGFKEQQGDAELAELEAELSGLRSQ